jgi:hypothetical protein
MTIGTRRFQVHKAQKIAAALLLIFLLQALWLVAHLPFNMAETRNALVGRSLWTSHQLLGAHSPLIPGDSILALRCAGLLPALSDRLHIGHSFSVYAAPNRWLVRLPFVAFSVWLGGALWWVSRRIFGDEGGYIALGLYCLSPPILLASATAESPILAAWGLFGLVFTAIGVAHTLYAPASKWRTRIVLFGVAVGLTAAANVGASVAGLALGAAFMLYLAPGRRLASLAIVTASSLIGAIVLLLCFGFDFRELAAAALIPNREYVSFTAHRVVRFLLIPGAVLEIFAFLALLLVFVLWRRARYFGNAAPLLPALLLPWWPGQYLPGASIVWALPFVFSFVGGVYADLLESRFFHGRFRRMIAATACVLVAAGAVLSLMLVANA